MKGEPRSARNLLAATLAGLPHRDRDYLLSSAPAVPVLFNRILDPTWLDTQIGLQANWWPTVDRPVLATTWWYSVSQVFLTPMIVSLLVTGRALSARPDDVQLHRLRDGRVLTAASTAVARGADPVAAAATGLRDSLEMAIPAVARAGAGRERPLWALATDSLANRALWAGRACGEVDRATSLAAKLVELVGAPMPAPRFVDVDRHQPGEGQVRFVRRGSCCLVYLEPGVAKCASCPRLAPEFRADQLRSAADSF